MFFCIKSMNIKQLNERMLFCTKGTTVKQELLNKQNAVPNQLLLYTKDGDMI